MEAPLSNSLVAGKQYKYDDFEAEIKAVREYLSKTIASATMVAAALNIYRPNLSRHKRKLQEQGLLFECYRDRCKITGRLVNYLTTDKERANKYEQS